MNNVVSQAESYLHFSRELVDAVERQLPQIKHLWTGSLKVFWRAAWGICLAPAMRAL
jgi:hypothetical protein